MSEVHAATVVVGETGESRYGLGVTAAGHHLTADEPQAVGGADTGPSPYELLLAALGACTAITMRMYAERHGWAIGKISVALRRDKVASPAGGGSDRFERVIEIAGALTEEQRRKLLAIAERCPVSETLRRPSEIVTKLL